MISVLFAARDSVYKTIPGLDVWDEERNALNWPGGNPGIFHPPCRLWCMLRRFSSAPESEKELAWWALAKVRRFGGILEHPAFTKFWDAALLPSPGQRDDYGCAISVDQFWFGHPSRKATWLYICGVDDIPAHPIKLAGSYDNVFTGHGRKAPARKRKFRKNADRLRQVAC